jgi:hypothetical protein
MLHPLIAVSLVGVVGALRAREGAAEQDVNKITCNSFLFTIE